MLKQSSLKAQAPQPESILVRKTKQTPSFKIHKVYAIPLVPVHQNGCISRQLETSLGIIPPDLFIPLFNLLARLIIRLCCFRARRVASVLDLRLRNHWLLSDS